MTVVGKSRLMILGVGLVVSVMGATLVFSVQADSSTPKMSWFAGGSDHAIPSYAFKAAGGKASGTYWSAWFFGKGNGTNCWGSKVRQKKVPAEEGALEVEEFATCGMNVPSDYWQQGLRGGFGSGENRKELLFFMTRSEVTHLRILLERKDEGRPKKSTLLRVYDISPKQARRARLRRNFGFAVAVVPGPACVKKVSALDNSGERLEPPRSLSCIE